VSTAGLGWRRSRETARLTAIVVAATATACVVTALIHGRDLGSTSALGRPAAQVLWAGTALVSVGLLWGVWSLASDRPLASIGLSGTGVGLLLPTFASITSLPAGVRAALLALTPATVGAVALVTLGWPRPTERRTPPAFGVVALALGAGVAHVLGYDPFADVACDLTCETFSAPLAVALGARNAVGVGALLAVVAGGWTIASVVRAPGVPGQLRVAGVTASALLACAVALPWWGWDSGGFTLVVRLLTLSAAALVAGSAVVAVVRQQRVRRRVARLLTELTQPVAARPAGVGPRAVHFSGTGSSGWVASDGTAVHDPDGQCLVLTRDGDPTIRIVLAAREDPAQVSAEITPAMRLALENARLDALGLARVVALRASQLRIVAATDTERRRLERDLHDGAQQRLVAVGLHLRAAGLRAERSAADRLAAAAGEVRAALEALRDLAHGAVPEALDQEGLEAAIRERASSTRTPVTVHVHVHGTVNALPEPVSTTAYLCAAAALDNLDQHARARQGTVTICQTEGRVELSIADDGVGMDGATLGVGLTEIDDRAGALGGQLALSERKGGGTVVTLVLPCGS
jgi:signal transduction histidine kinase